jgi:hypothetical protein
MFSFSNKCNHACCKSSYSIESQGSGRSSLDGKMKVSILGSLDNRLTLECIVPGLWIMTNSEKVANTKPQAASLLFAFSYVFAQVRAKWLVTSSILSPSMKGWKRTRLSFTARASLSVAEYQVSAEANT